MSNTYRATSKAGEARFAPGVFEHEFATGAEELDWLNNGVLELVPRDYLVTSRRFSIEGQPLQQGWKLTAGFPMEIEAMHIANGHLQRVEDADYEEPTKDDLLEKAKELNIPGRSKMTKEELVDAITAAESIAEADQADGDN